MEIVEDIVIVGAGLAGLATSLGLYKLGLRSLVLESSDRLRTTGFTLSVWTNAWRALDALGIGDKLRQNSLQLQGFEVSSLEFGLPTTGLLFDQSENIECRCTRRKELLETLAKELPPGTIRFSSKVVSLQEAGCTKWVQLADGCVVRAKVVIGCDGVNSMVARWLGLQKPILTGRSAIRGLVDFPDHGFKPKYNVYFGHGIRLGFVPCDAKSIFWFCTFDTSIDNWHDDMEKDPGKLKKFVLSNTSNIPREALDVLERTKLDSISFAALKLRLPWDILIRNFAKSGIVVAGDALHPMTPDLGQGGCSALEDSVVLARCIGECFKEMQKRDWMGEDEDAEISASIKKGMDKYMKERRWRSFRLIVTAYMVGFVQESDGKVMSFLRDKFLSKYSAAATMKMSDYDCGNLLPPEMEY